MNQSTVMAPRLIAVAPLNLAAVVGNFDKAVMAPRLIAVAPMNLAKVIGNFANPTVGASRLIA
jgi:hypothetical protein